MGKMSLSVVFAQILDVWFITSLLIKQPIPNVKLQFRNTTADQSSFEFDLSNTSKQIQ